ncbi:MAG: LolA family outer membrane lipoprotein carrier protein [Hyphomonas sp. BRH_c22]|uniref:LolA family protein n=1 Tax=Hyphomonas sp. BRH_c22 TaxID=1629710 RepID=UPI0005F1140D|nr:outer membrane lipoprotein carrier protein LolA [Hyphomonas sp. BRH_c22]KJS39018.1 MAG: LolA family outer membrane lipoprotein carrier protein [Hyphomonas sp. BRH_c22]
MMNLLTTLGAITAIATAPLAVSLQDAVPVAPPVTAPATTSALTAQERSAILKSVSQAMTEVRTARGKFEQLAPDYTVSTGSFALSRPGKVRFDYDDPTPILIVSNGATVAMQDSELETTDRVPLSSTPLSLLLDDSLDFENEAQVLDVVRANGRIGVTLRDRSGEMDGTLTLVLSDVTKELLGWRTEDTGGNITSVQLVDVEYGKKLNPRLFILKDFDDE